MNFRRLPLSSLLVTALLLTTGGDYASVVTAQDPAKESTDQTTDGSKTATPTGFPTGAKCTKTGTYKAENKYLRVVIVVAEGEEFPPFADGKATTWSALTSSTKSTFEGVKVPTSDPK